MEKVIEIKGTDLNKVNKEVAAFEKKHEVKSKEYDTVKTIINEKEEIEYIVKITYIDNKKS